MSGHFGRVEEAFSAGREQGFDRGYEEGFDAARQELAGGRIPKASPASTSVRSVAPAIAPAPAASPTTSEGRILGLGLLGLLAYGAWRLLRTWPGRIVAAGSLVAMSGLVSLGLAVLAVLIVGVAVAWAASTLERAVHDTRRGLGHARAVARYVGGRLRA